MTALKTSKNIDPAMNARIKENIVAVNIKPTYNIMTNNAHRYKDLEK